MRSPVFISYLLALVAVWVVLECHLLSSVLTGLAVYVLTTRLARRLPAGWGAKARGIALGGIILAVALLVAVLFVGLLSFFQGHEGMAALTGTAAERLEDLKRNLPPYLAKWVPDSMEELRGELAEALRAHGRNVSHAGLSIARILAHVVAGMVIGGITVLHRFKDRQAPPPFVGALHDRLRALAEAFHKVVFAQVRVSLLNTALTALYLLAVLPLCGVRMPMRTLLILLTFFAGLLPVIGNLISNGIIVMISLGVSAAVAVASLVFLLFVHKLEYFVNARIVGRRVEANSWELLSAMLVMEAAFGMAGLIAAPVLYAWLKAELKAREIV